MIVKILENYSIVTECKAGIHLGTTTVGEIDGSVLKIENRFKKSGCAETYIAKFCFYRTAIYFINN